MGCDIHIYAETKKENGNWEKVGKVFDYPYYRPDEPQKVDEDGYEWNPAKTDQPYTGRNYNLFGILADVRNGRGFAGCDTGDRKNPIDDPRDLPEDVSDEVNRLFLDWGGDGHTPSWFTVKELLDYDWDQTTKNRGYIFETEYEKWDGKFPDYSCGWICGENIVTISSDEYNELKSKNLLDKNIKYYIQVEWEMTYRECVGESFFKTIEELKKLGDPNDVRIVFWFDN